MTAERTGEGSTERTGEGSGERTGEGSAERTGDPRPGRDAGPAGDPSHRVDPGIPVQPTADQGATRLRELPGRSWWTAAGRTVRNFADDDLGDWAGTLAYYGILSIFPGLLLLVTVLRLTGSGTTDAMVDNISGMAPGNVHLILQAAVDGLQHSRRSASGIIAIASLAGALWSASGYIGAFMRASNAIYGVPERRPLWKRVPLRLGLTVVTGILLTASAVIVVFTGRLAVLVGDALGLGSRVVTVWGIAKWPVLVAIVVILFDILFWASPNARHGGFRWVTPGGLLAVVIWVAVSAGFALFVTHFDSYSTYGSLATVIIFLVWLWISNLAVLLGAEFDAELQRGRAIRAGHPPGDEPYVDLRNPKRPASSDRGDRAPA
jgi:membrane protein